MRPLGDPERVDLELGPLGAAFLFWDIGMKRGNVSLLGVLSSPRRSSPPSC